MSGRALVRVSGTVFFHTIEGGSGPFETMMA
jgi:hypothetical protein